VVRVVSETDEQRNTDKADNADGMDGDLLIWGWQPER
jgi:hypothetical protein